MERILIFFGKLISVVSSATNLGAGATWPGEIALRLDPDILTPLSQKVRKGIILVAGTNGKTTTTLMLKTILERQGDSVIHNGSGANLLNGIVSSFIQHASWTGTIEADWGVFEVDENSLPIVIKSIKSIKLKVVIVLLNLFRDQLDRYGEVDVIAEKWRKLKFDCLIANADDPLIAEIARKAIKNVTFFGLDDPSQYMEKMEHATDSTFCPRCGTRLTYKGIYYSHIGDWSCPKCKNKRPALDISTWDYPLPGLYNRYNTLAAVATAKTVGIADQNIKQALQNFSPAFGRQEEFTVDGKKVKIFLSKNPAGFNESLRTVIQLDAKQILFVLNDRIPDGRDVSWIWDVDFEMLPENINIFVSGDRAYDAALRLKYAGIRDIRVINDIREAVQNDLYILPTYSAMLDVRKILTGKKIL
jgi:UDP-N-acetylmuramyl tripeptide synthase